MSQVAPSSYPARLHLEGVLNAPSRIDSSFQRGALDAESLGPCAQRKRHAIKRYPTSRALVALLLGGGGPSAVARGIIAVVVNALNGISTGWPWANIGQKRLEGVEPSGAHAYASRSVLGEAFGASIKAPRFDASPSAIFGATSSSFGMAVLEVLRCDRGAPVATTRLGSAGSQVGRLNPQVVAAGAFAESALSRPPALVRDHVNNGQLAKHAACEPARLLHMIQSTTGRIPNYTKGQK